MKHLFAHNSKFLIKVGDKVRAYDEWIGEIGNAGGYYYAHLHYSESEGLTDAQLKSYVIGWSKAEVEKYYREPTIDRDKMFNNPVDNGEAGYSWLQSIGGRGNHPGIDYNGFGGGNSDYGYKFKSPVDGEVIFIGDWGSGWGKVIIIDDNNLNNTMEKKHEENLYKIYNQVEDILGREDGKNPNNRETDAILEGLKTLATIEPEIIYKDCTATLKKLGNKTQEVEDLKIALEKRSALYKLLLDAKRLLSKIWGLIK